jgi:hypothetical protein
MPFAYYERLSRTQKATYRRSDALGSVPLPDAPALRPLLETLKLSLLADDRRRVAGAVAGFAEAMLTQLQVAPVVTEVLDRRPSSDTAELHGLYTREEGVTPRIQLWMRTAANARPVAGRTFLRTLLHELLHHLDFELFALEDTFHTQGFYRRESNLVRQLEGDEAIRREPASRRQLDLFAKPKK